MSNNLSLRSRDIQRQVVEQELLIQENDSASSLNDSKYKSFEMSFDRNFAFSVIPELKGKSNIEVFINQCDAIYEEFGEEDCEASLMAIIRRKISNNVWLACKDCTKYNELKDRLLNKFCDDTPLSAMMNKLVLLSQYHSEDIKSYADRASDIYDRLMLLSETFLKKAPVDSRDDKPVKLIYQKLLLDYWVKGIRDTNLRQVVLSHNAPDFPSASKYAKDIEVVFRTYNSNNATDSFSKNIAENNTIKKVIDPQKSLSCGNNNSKLKNDNQYPEKKSNFTSKAGSSGQKPNLKCNFCGKQGHVESKCRKKQPQQVNILQSKNDTPSEKIPPDMLINELVKALNLR